MDYFKVRRKFDRPYRVSAVTLILEEGYSVKNVSKELGVHYNSLYRWVAEYEKHAEDAFPRHGSALFNAQYENRKFQRENESL